jgi:hypothetical protein
MGILLAFSPFLAFVVVEQLAGTTAGLIAAALVSVCVLIHSRKLRILEVGSALLFGALAVCAAMNTHANWSIAAMRLCVDSGLLLIILASLALRRPFTLQYAREQVSADVANSRTFLRVNDIMTIAWSAAFGVLILADLMLLYRPQWPMGIAIALSVSALASAAKFTAWYPEHRRSNQTRA